MPGRWICRAEKRWLTSRAGKPSLGHFVRHKSARLRLADTETLINLFRQTVRTVNRRDYSENQVLAWAPDTIDSKSWLQRLQQNRTRVAVVGGQIAGFAELTDDGCIHMLYVSPAHQRRGVAKALIRGLETVAREQGMQRLHSRASLTAVGLFERLGFRRLGARQVAVGDQPLTCFHMEKTWMAGRSRVD